MGLNDTLVHSSRCHLNRTWEQHHVERWESRRFSAYSWYDGVAMQSLPADPNLCDVNSKYLEFLF